MIEQPIIILVLLPNKSAEYGTTGRAHRLPTDMIQLRSPSIDGDG
jgi:hypothetical protein